MPLAAVRLTLAPPEVIDWFTVIEPEAETEITALFVKIPTGEEGGPITKSPVLLRNTPPLITPRAAIAATAISNASFDVPTPVAESMKSSPAVMSAGSLPPSVIEPLTAISPTLFEPASSPVTEIEPPAINTGLRNVELMTVTGPMLCTDLVPAATATPEPLPALNGGSPIRIDANPLVSAAMSESVMSNDTDPRSFVSPTLMGASRLMGASVSCTGPRADTDIDNEFGPPLKSTSSARSSVGPFSATAELYVCDWKVLTEPPNTLV